MLLQLYFFTLSSLFPSQIFGEDKTLLWSGIISVFQTIIISYFHNIFPLDFNKVHFHGNYKNLLNFHLDFFVFFAKHTVSKSLSQTTIAETFQLPPDPPLVKYFPSSPLYPILSINCFPSAPFASILCSSTLGTRSVYLMILYKSSIFELPLRPAPSHAAASSVIKIL